MSDDSSIDETDRRSILKKASAGTLVLTGLAGCSGGGGDGSSSETEIEFWTQETQEERVGRINEIADTFEEEYDGTINVNGIVSGDFASEFQSARASGDLFTASQISQIQLDPIRGTDIPAFDYHQNVVDTIGEDEYIGRFLDFVRTDNGLLAVPVFAWAQALWYRQSVFDEAGLDFVPRSWDQILEAAETLHDPDNDQFGIAIGAQANDFYAQQCYTMFALANDAPLFSEDGEILFDNDKHIETLEFYDQLYEYTSSGIVEPGDAFNQYANGQTHLTPIAPHILQYVADIADDPASALSDIRHTGYIEEERQTSFGLIEGYYIINSRADDAQKETAQKFLEFLSWEDEQEHYMNWLDVQIGGFQPVFEGFTEREEYRNQDVMQHVDESVLEAIPQSLQNFERFGGYIYDDYFPVIGEIETQFLITEAVNRVVQGENAQDVAEDIADQMRDLQE